MAVTETILLAGAITGALTVLGVAAHKIGKATTEAVRSAAAVREVLLGSPAESGAITGRPVPAVPGIGERMTAVESTLRQLADQHAEIAGLHQIAADHERRLVELETHRAETIVTRAEAAQAWRAVANIAEAGTPDDID